MDAVIEISLPSIEADKRSMTYPQARDCAAVSLIMMISVTFKM